MRVAKRSWKVGGVLLAGGALWLGPKPVPGSALAVAGQPPAKASFQLVGSGSCAARNCHGRIDPVPGQEVGQNEFFTWTGHDKHSQAYEVLAKEPSRRIEMLLRQLPDLEHAKPYTDDLCLRCHVHPQYTNRVAGLSGRDFNGYGVGCESCHGAASAWLAAHTSEDWTRMALDAKKARGMIPTQDVRVRADLCVSCHVGSANADVNHDLIAAGHPRLNFEFAAFMANMPRHWTQKDPIEVEKQKDPARFETQSWVAGQEASARAALELLKFRAGPGAGASRPWPEFAEYDCFACHHDLHDPSWRQQRDLQRPPDNRPKPGSLRRSDWYTLMPGRLADYQGDRQVPKDLEQLNYLMARPYLQRQAIADLAGTTARRLVNEKLPSDTGVLLALLAADYRQCEAPSWDEAAQLYLAAAALKGGQQFKGTIGQMADALAYRRGYDSPKDYKPRERFDELLKVLLPEPP
jgi:Cytochrome c554 and c-prime